MPLNVRDTPYGAKGDSVTDDTLAFQSALVAAETIGDTVFVPPGTYRIDGTLRVPAYVTLEGVWKAPPFSSPVSSKPEDKGTVLLAYWGREDVNASPFITLGGHSAGVKGLVIY